MLVFRSVASTVATALLTATLAVQGVTLAQGPAAAPSRVPVLAELFTSEGCSSCPAADDLLRRLIEEQPVEGVEVIAISEHVDYWDRLGWKDSFSSNVFTKRQEEYGRALRRNPIYTPQLVVDGRMEVIGSEWPDVRRTLLEAARAPRASVVVTAEASPSTPTATVTVAVRDIPGPAHQDAVDVFVAIVENALTTEVLRGENAKRQLHHSAVARSLIKVGSLAKSETAGEFSQAVPLERDWKLGQLRAIAFLQRKANRQVLGAGTARIREISGWSSCPFLP
jgi:hypothetical protein